MTAANRGSLGGLNAGFTQASAVSTGVIYGAVITVNGGNPAAFDVSAGKGYIVDGTTSPTNPTVTLVTIPAQTIVITGTPATRTTNWWTCNSSGTISAQAAQPSEAQRRSSIQIGVTGSTIGTGVIFSIGSTPVILEQTTNQVYDVMYDLGPFTTSGNIISANGVNLNINKSAGSVFSPSFSYATTPANPHEVTTPAETPCTFRYATRVAGSEGALVTAIDPANYDVGGVITAVPGGGNTATIQRIWLFGTGISTGQLAIQYSQTSYASLAAAQSAIGGGSFVTNPDFQGIATLIGYLCVIKSATDLSNVAQATFVNPGKFPTP